MAPKLAPASLLSFVKARVEFLDLNMLSGMVAGSERHLAMSQKVVEAIRTQTGL